jgi:peptidoglycan/xylan/chitin deacetylase (PgdA/CDA1 family)
MSPVKRLLYTLWSVGGLAALPRFLTRNRLKIVLYHGVSPSGEGIFNYRRKFVSPQSFERQIAYFRRHYTILPLDEAVMRLYAGKLPPRALAITFDDGYRNNYEYAFPVLKKYNVPVAIFLVTDFVFGNTPLWVDRLEYAIAHGPESKKEKVALDSQKRREMKELANDERLRQLEELERSRGMVLHAADADPRYAPLTRDMLREMRAAGVMFGAHTESHPILSRVSPDEARTEIVNSRDAVARECGVVSHVFTYPNGEPGDWTDETEKILAEADFAGALTTIPGVNGRATPRMRLKRISMDRTEDWPEYIATESGLRGILQKLKKVWSY